jgi:hypothetical protein
MNGRIYDPTLGRFLQADPHIQAPMNSQNYNRYSYVLNNPMSYTDPSGYLFKALGKFVKKYWRVIAAAAVTYVTAGAASGWAAGWGYATGTVANGAIAGAIAGAAGGFVATGSLRGAFTGAVTGAAFGAIGASFETNGAGHIGSHALTGGILSDLQGGKFGHGFWSAGLTKAANVNGIVGTTQGVDWDIARIAVAATIGGTISKITGGKFGNGAVTAGFAQMLNGNRQAKREDAVKQALKTLKSEYSLINRDDGLVEHPAKGHKLGTYVTKVTEREGGFLGFGGEEKTYYLSSDLATVNGADFLEHMSSPLAGPQSSPQGVTDWFLAIPDGGGVDFRFAEVNYIQSIYAWDVSTGITNHYTYSQDTQSWSSSVYRE